MSVDVSSARVRLFRSFHETGVLVLPNAWDPMSAVMMADAGARAIATTSGGVAWALGHPDGQHVTRAQMMDAVGRIVSAVDVPVTADVEAGYGPTTDDVAATVEATVDAGAVGINLEDSKAAGGPLFTADEQGTRIEAARKAASGRGMADLVINARTDVFLFQVGDPAGRLDDVRARADRYAEAGADCLFVPGLLDLAVLETLVDASPLPVNVMAMPGGPSVSELAAVGVRRVSVGTALAQTAYSAAQRATRELLESGTYGGCEGAASFGEINSLLVRPAH